MQQSSWLKENIFLVAAVVLPLAVAGLFLIATALPRAFVDPPAYALLVAIDERVPAQSSFGIDFEVVNNRLKAYAVYSTSHRYSGHSKLFRFTPGAAQLERIDVSIDDELRALLEAEAHNVDKDEARRPLPLPEHLSRLELITLATAPDGYRFRSDYRGGAGLFGELFGMGSRNRVVAIEKDGRIVELGAELEQLQGYAYYNVQFLGWIAGD